jgi:hypothetical protein
MKIARKSWLAGCLALTTLCLAGTDSLTAEEKPAPVKVIFDCDMGNDCDDAGALAILHALADNGEADILACMMWKMRKDEPKTGPAAVIDAINTYYGRPDIPIGIGKKGFYFAGASLASSGDGKNPVKAFFAGQQSAPYGSIAMAAALYGVRGAQAFWDDTTTGANYIQPATGETRWMSDLKRDQQHYLIQKKSPREMETLLNDLMAQPPRNK